MILQKDRVYIIKSKKEYEDFINDYFNQINNSYSEKEFWLIRYSEYGDDTGFHILDDGNLMFASSGFYKDHHRDFPKMVPYGIQKLKLEKVYL
jgi:hypothetical protein